VCLHTYVSVPAHKQAPRPALRARRSLLRSRQCPRSEQALERLFALASSSVTNGGAFVNNEVQDVFLVRGRLPLP
jgi:hypothetical protein